MSANADFNFVFRGAASWMPGSSPGKTNERLGNWLPYQSENASLNSQISTFGRLPPGLTATIFDAVLLAEGVNRWRLLAEWDAAPAGSASSAEPPGALGDTARPNYMGPSGNGLVERMKAGETPWNQGRSNGRPCPFPEGGPEDEGKTPR